MLNARPGTSGPDVQLLGLSVTFPPRQRAAAGTAGRSRPGSPRRPWLARPRAGGRGERRTAAHRNRGAQREHRPAHRTGRRDGGRGVAWHRLLAQLPSLRSCRLPRFVPPGVPPALISTAPQRPAGRLSSLPWPRTPWANRLLAATEAARTAHGSVCARPALARALSQVAGYGGGGPARASLGGPLVCFQAYPAEHPPPSVGSAVSARRPRGAV